MRSRLRGQPDSSETKASRFFTLSFRLEQSKLSVAGIDGTAIDEYVASERERVLDELAGFLAANERLGPELSLRVEEGGVFEVIARIVEETRPVFSFWGPIAVPGCSRCC